MLCCTLPTTPPRLFSQPTLARRIADLSHTKFTQRLPFGFGPLNDAACSVLPKVILSRTNQTRGRAHSSTSAASIRSLSRLGSNHAGQMQRVRLADTHAMSPKSEAVRSPDFCRAHHFLLHR